MDALQRLTSKDEVSIEVKLLSRRTVLLALFAIVLFALILRYPLVEHERHQSDSYSLHLFSQAIVDDGYAKWTLHPFSYLGYFPLSYPSGVPFLLAGISEMTGLTIESSVLLFNMVIGVLFCLVVFCLAREFILRPEFVLLAVLMCTAGPRLVDTTYWVASARGPLVVLMTFAVFAFLRAGRTNQRRMLIPATAFVAACFTVHHMAVLLIVFAAGYVLAVSSKMLQDALIRRGVRFATTVRIIVVVSLSVTAVSFTFLDYFAMYFERSFTLSEYLFDFEPEILSAIANMVASYTHQLGFIIVFGFLGFVELVCRKKVDNLSVYLVAFTMPFFPLIGNPLYLSMILLPVVALLGATYLSRMRNRIKVRNGVIAVLVVVSLCLPVWSTSHWNSNEYLTGDTVEVDDGVFNDANYMLVNMDGTYSISNAETLSLQLAGITGEDFLRSGIPMAVSGDVTLEDLRSNISWAASSFPMNLYYWFKYDEDEYPYYVNRLLMINGLTYLDVSGRYNEFAEDIFSKHSRLLVVVDNWHPYDYAGRWDIQPSALLREVESAEYEHSVSGSVVTSPLGSYLIYRSERTSIFCLQIPD